MATPVDKSTDVEVFQRELKKKRATYGYTSNKYGRIVLVNKEAYENMLRNNDTLRDENGLNDVFANLSKKDLDTLKKCVKMKDREKANETKDAIVVSAVSKLRNFMARFQAGDISDEVTRLSETVLDELRDMEVAGTSVDMTAEIEEKDAEIEALKAQLVEAKKAKAPKAPAKKTAKKVEDAEDTQNGEDTGTDETGAGADAGATGDAGTGDNPFDE